MSGIVKSITGVVGSLLGLGAAPAAPVLEPTKAMPTMDTAAIQAAKQKSIAAQQQRSGRMSTFLSDSQGQSDKLGS